MREFARGFYLSKEWKKTSRAYMASRQYICERCGGIGAICHHRKWLNEGNINNPQITLNWDNLECLCAECHAREHMSTRDRVYFDEAGNIERVKDSARTREYKKQSEQIDLLLERIKNEKNDPEIRVQSDEKG